MNYIIKLTLLGLMLLSLVACTFPVRDLYFGEIKWTVVDADTNKPIADAVVYVKAGHRQAFWIHSGG